MRIIKTIPTDFTLEKDKKRIAKEEADRKAEADKIAKLTA